MQFSTFQLLLSLLPFTLAQNYGGGGGSSSTTSAAAAPSPSIPSNVHIISVGKDGLSFSPNTTTAAVGEAIQFEFYPPAHSVAQSAFASPCTPLGNGTGFFSGGIMTTGDAENINVFTITVNDTNPIWFYCAVPGHCEAGMAGVINPPSDASTSLASYVAAAAKANTVAPSAVQGGVIGPEAASTSSSPSPSPTAAKGAGIEARGSIPWVSIGLTGILAVGVGSLML
ncbi:putative GPI-anchored cupredoxin [Lachnellula suecica]|uniref:Putative GPI-anchored cupredoxin n=1 Tax=Lachnellula suecica TaxID=602035 RepID=A0A8T9CQI4_9HELO|nr:putative GPI-anchored cupredoxin [Lachnellula suecica]